MILDEKDSGLLATTLAQHWGGNGLPLGDEKRIVQELSLSIAAQLGDVAKDVLALPREQLSLRLREILPELSWDSRDRMNLDLLLSPDWVWGHGPVHILLLSANPDSVHFARVDREFKRIEEALEHSVARDLVTFVARHAVTMRDLRRAFLDHRPHILHFAGHGTEGKIALDDGHVLLLKDLARLVDHTKSIRLVVLNACLTAFEADAITAMGPAVIAHRCQVDDEDAIEFAANFYEALVRQESLAQSFDRSVDALKERGRTGDDIPVLIAGSKDPNKIWFSPAPW